MGMTVDAIPGRRLRWRLDGKLAEPGTRRWKVATPAERAKYWPILADRLLVEWRGQMLAGRGRRGKVRRARPISRLAYRQAGEASTGPGLLPRRDESRAFRHARVTPYADLGRVTGYWATGFGRILSYHHTGTAGRGIPWYDDAGRIRWRGLPGQVTGVVRDLLPTATTVALAVASASARWARLVGAKGGGREDGTATVAVADRPARRPAARRGVAARPIARPPRRFATAEAAQDWADRNLATPVADVRKADLGTAREAIAAVAAVESRIGGPLPAAVRFAYAGDLPGKALAAYDPGSREILLRGWLGGETYAEAIEMGNRRHRARTGGEAPFAAFDPASGAEGILWHEIGHAVDYLAEDRGELPRSRTLRRLWFEDETAAGQAAMARVSGYAASDWWALRAGREAWAECWAAVVTGSSRAGLVPAPVREMIEAEYARLVAAGHRGEGAAR